MRAISVSDAAPVVIRVHRPGYHEPDEIRSELEWIAALRADSVLSTPAPVATQDGAAIATFDHAGEARQVVAFEFMPGFEPDEEQRAVGDPLIKEIIARLAFLDSVGLGYLTLDRPADFRKDVLPIFRNLCVLVARHQSEHVLPILRKR